MKLKKMGAAIAATTALFSGSTLIAATPAAAVGGCPSGKLCLYRSTEYRTLAFTSTSTSACFSLKQYGMGYGTNGINSYVNNLSVKATIWRTEHPDTAWSTGTIRPGGFTSNTQAVNPDNSGYEWRSADQICTGSAKP
ncbi:peptidase inhibitor family I36 protein [Streptomyces sp. NPDC091272]|uniref:peptidase inhibitor family I36 protein n=1 Tax=Streptomyces sp. NPDC091272 TaxID=3365981 RepID=UPI00383057DA